MLNDPSVGELERLGGMVLDATISLSNYLMRNDLNTEDTRSTFFDIIDQVRDTLQVYDAFIDSKLVPSDLAQPIGTLVARLERG